MTGGLPVVGVNQDEIGTKLGLLKEHDKIVIAADVATNVHVHAGVDAFVVEIMGLPELGTAASG